MDPLNLHLKSAMSYSPPPKVTTSPTSPSVAVNPKWPLLYITSHVILLSCRRFIEALERCIWTIMATQDESYCVVFYWAPLAAVTPPPSQPSVRGLFSVWPTHGDLSTSWLDCSNPFTQPQNPITLALERERVGGGRGCLFGRLMLDSVCVSVCPH